MMNLAQFSKIFLGAICCFSPLLTSGTAFSDPSETSIGTYFHQSFSNGEYFVISNSYSETSRSAPILTNLINLGGNEVTCSFMNDFHCRGDCYWEGTVYTVGDSAVKIDNDYHDNGYIENIMSDSVSYFIEAAKRDDRASIQVPALSTGWKDEKTRTIVYGKKEVIEHIRSLYSDLEVRAKGYCERHFKQSGTGQSTEYKKCLDVQLGYVAGLKSSCSI